MKYSELLDNHDNNHSSITYWELLQTLEWQQKRSVILDRDSYCCRKCNIQPIKGSRVYGLSGFTEEILLIGDSFKKVKFPDLRFDPNGVYLEVHHLYYILNRLPWEINDDGLITLCNKCHEELHFSEKVPVYNLIEGKLVRLELIPCKKCGGTGFLPYYRHYQNGLCFKCYGSRWEAQI